MGVFVGGVVGGIVLGWFGLVGVFVCVVVLILLWLLLVMFGVWCIVGMDVIVLLVFDCNGVDLV